MVRESGNRATSGRCGHLDASDAGDARGRLGDLGRAEHPVVVPPALPLPEEKTDSVLPEQTSIFFLWHYRTENIFFLVGEEVCTINTPFSKSSKSTFHLSVDVNELEFHCIPRFRNQSQCFEVFSNNLV